MQTILVIILVLFMLFAFVILYGAPYLPTKQKQIEDALDLLGLKQSQTLLELGCGDGRVLKAAAKRGIRCVGYELNPVLALAARLVTWRQRGSVKVIWANYWNKQWPDTDGIYVFLLDKFMERLDKKITQRYKDKNIKLVSFAFEVKTRRPYKIKNGLFLYHYK